MSGVARLAWNDARAVLPYLLGAIAVTVLAGLPRIGAEGWSIAGWYFGSMAIGAAVVGHEFAHRTCGLLLSLPVSRRALLATKLSVAAVAIALVGVAFVSWGPMAWPTGRPLHMSFYILGTPLVLVALVGLVVAPLITLLTRSVLAGALCSAAAPLLAIASLSAAGLEGESSEDLLRAAGMVTTALVAGSAVALGWVFRRRLEDREPAPRQIHLGVGVTVVPRQWVSGRWGRLAEKELHLQELPLAVTGLYAVGVLLAWLSDGRMPFRADPRSEYIASIYAVIQAVLIGAVSAATERELGVLPTQLTAPVSSRAQFLVKTLVTLAVSLVLAVLVPLAAAATWGHPERFAPSGTPLMAFALSTAGLTLVALYVSTWSHTALRAFLATPVVLAAMWLPMSFAVFLVTSIERLLRPMPVLTLASRTRIQVGQTLALLLLAAFATFVWHLALQHYRSPRPSGRQVVRDLVAMVGFVVLTGSLVALALKFVALQ